MAINVVDDYLFILMIYEKTVINDYHEYPELNDTHVIAAYSAAMNFFTRQKKGLPELPVLLSGNTLRLFNKLKEVTEGMIDPEKKQEEDDSIIANISISVAIACFKRLKESAENWHKRDGFRGYLKLVVDYV